MLMAQSCRYDQNTLGWVICSPVDHKLHSLSLSPFIHSCYMPAFESMTLVCHLVCSPQVYTSCLISVQPLSRVQPIATPWTAVCQASLWITNPPQLAQTHVHRVGDAIEPSSAIPLSSYLQSFPASGSFPMSQFFAPGGQNIGVSVSNEYSGLISFSID